MKLLIFEFATATGLDDPSITAEGHAMLYGLLDDLKGLKTHHLISDVSEIENSESIPVVLNDDIENGLKRISKIMMHVCQLHPKKITSSMI